MFCDACGAKIEPGQRFCPSCGRLAVATGAPSTPAGASSLPQTRVGSNIKLLGILWLIYSGLHFIPGAIAWVLFSGNGFNILPADVPPYVPFLIQAGGAVLCAISAVGLLAGWGLLAWKSWGRLLALVLGVLNLINLPFGTALGFYTLWVLLPNESEREYQRHLPVGI